MSETVEKIDTLPVLRELGGVSHQMLSRGELKRRGVLDEAIDEAQKLGEVIIASTDDTRNGELSSLASVMLTDVGETKLDQAEG